MDYHARGVLYLPDEARYSHLLHLPEGADLGRAINDAMKSVEAENEDLAGVLPVNYQRLRRRMPANARSSSARRGSVTAL